MNQERHKRPLQEEKRAQIAVEKMAGRLSTLSPVIRATTKDENNIYERFYFKPEVRQWIECKTKDEQLCGNKRVKGEANENLGYKETRNVPFSQHEKKN